MRKARPRSETGDEKRKLEAEALEQGFRSLEKILHETKRDELSDGIRAEKRHIRYERILRPIAYRLRFRDLSFEFLRRNKDKLWPDRSSHRCVPAKCEWECATKGSTLFDPFDRARTVRRASGKVFVCKKSGKAHVCDESTCTRSVVRDQGALVCEVSGFVTGAQISAGMPRGGKRLNNDDASTYYRSGDGDDDFCASGEAAGGDESGLSEAHHFEDGATAPELSPRRAPHNGADSGSETEGRDRIGLKSRKKRQADAVTGTFGKRHRAALEPRPNPVSDRSTDPRRALELLYYSHSGAPSERPVSSSSSSFSSLPAFSVERTAQYAKGSSAEKMLQRSSGGKSGAMPSYGNALIRYSFETITQTNRTCAEQICHAMLYHPNAVRIFEEKWKTDLRLSSQIASRYVERCVEAGVVPDRFYVYRIYWAIHHSIMDQTFLRHGIGTAEGAGASDHSARQYFTEAILKLWKILESSPYCCEMDLTHGGAASKKKRSRTHLKKVAPALLYKLRDGIFHTVSYDSATGLIIRQKASTVRTTDDPSSAPAVSTDVSASSSSSPSEGGRAEQPPDASVRSERICFVPPHRYLMRLPSENEIRSLDFRSVPGTGKVVGYIMENQRWITYCYRSLLCVDSPLRIEQVRQYRLSDHMRIFDEEDDGRFCLQVIESDSGSTKAAREALRPLSDDRPSFGSDQK